MLEPRIASISALKSTQQEHHHLDLCIKKSISAAGIADFEKWVAMGAPDPRTKSEATAEEKNLDLKAALRFLRCGLGNHLIDQSCSMQCQEYPFFLHIEIFSIHLVQEEQVSHVS